jgi:hypothetical protein
MSEPVFGVMRQRGFSRVEDFQYHDYGCLQ